MKPNAPAKKKIEAWRKDALQAIFTQCFSIHEYQFTTIRRLQVAYKKYQKDHEREDEEGGDEEAKARANE